MQTTPVMPNDGAWHYFPIGIKFENGSQASKVH